MEAKGQLFSPCLHCVPLYVALQVKALQSKPEGSQFKPHEVIDQALGPNLVAKLLLTFRSSKYHKQ